jgi:hypothetical protein
LWVSSSRRFLQNKCKIETINMAAAKTTQLF